MSNLITRNLILCLIGETPMLMMEAASLSTVAVGVRAM